MKQSGTFEKRSTVASNMGWRFLERIAAQAVGFIVSMILARLLEPSVYGLTAIVLVITNILQVFIDSGMGTALIQADNPDDIDYSSVFWFNFIASWLLYFIAYCYAPFIAELYNEPQLIPVIRVLSLTLVVAGVKNIQQSYVAKHMLFKKFFYATSLGTIIAATVGIIMAMKGFGVWALVTQHLVNITVDTVVLWIVVGWHPRFIISWKKLTSLLSFGWKILLSKVIDVVYNNIRTLIIGKVYSSADLAFYNRGEIFPITIVTNINTSIDSVLLPVMSDAKNDIGALKNMVRHSIRVSVYIIAPVMVGLIAVAEPLINLILTEKWMPCVFYLRIFCISYMFYPIHTANLNAIKAMGRSDLFLKLEVLKKIVGIILLVATVPISVKAMGYSLLGISIASQIINSWPNKKLLNYGYVEQLRDIFPGIVLAICMGCVVFAVQFLGLPDMLTILLQIVVGISFYIIGSNIMRIEEYRYVLRVLRSMIHH